ncbi:MAG: NAD(P)H-binding protein [Solirubrobacteraceae bacterium]|nr:NAD(P)H-binding protein [Solirubrobacteraceae bacterium]
MMIGVTGASGHLGRSVAEGLLGVLPPDQVVLVTREPHKLADLAARGAVVRQGDFDKPAGLAAAFAGIDRLLLISTDALGARVPGHLAAVGAAADAGVAHVVYTSVGNPSDDNPAVVAPEHRATEDALRASGVHWTFLRNGIYADLQLAPGVGAVATGTLLANSGSGGSAYVTRADCAAAAVAVLTGEGHENKIYDITGPKAVDAHGLAAIYSEISGRPVTAVLVDDAAWIAAMVEHAGMAEPIAAAYASFGAAQRAGYAAVATDTVLRLTGRPATSLREFVGANRDAFVPTQI